MFFQLPVCSCEPNYHSSQKIAALWKKEEGVLFSFCDNKVLLSGSSSSMKKLACICFCYLDLFFFHGLFCRILVSLSYDIVAYIVYVMGTEVEVPVLRCIFLHLSVSLSTCLVVKLSIFCFDFIFCLLFAQTSLMSLWLIAGVGGLRLHRVITCTVWPTSCLLPFPLLFTVVSKSANCCCFTSRFAAFPLRGSGVF